MSTAESSVNQHVSARSTSHQQIGGTSQREPPNARVTCPPRGKAPISFPAADMSFPKRLRQTRRWLTRMGCGHFSWRVFTSLLVLFDLATTQHVAAVPMAIATKAHEPLHESSRSMQRHSSVHLFCSLLVLARYWPIRGREQRHGSLGRTLGRARPYSNPRAALRGAAGS